MNKRLFWIWPFRVDPRTSVKIDALLAPTDALLTPAHWLPLSLLAGFVPILLGSLFSVPYHPALTTLLLLPLLLGCIRADRVLLATGIIGIVIGVHVLSVIGLTLHDPERMTHILSGSDAYWQKTWHWIQTGEDVAEYRPRDWLPEHLLLVIGVCALAYTSLGVVPLAVGIQQIDLMNYYVGRLILRSDHPVPMLLLGWHPWSILRGLAYSVLIFEVVSLSLERLLGRPLSTPKRRRIRWCVGLSLALADGLAKWILADSIREVLYNSLTADYR